MTDRQLISFVKTVEMKSISKAARSMFITPQAMLQQINALEREVAFPLLARNSQGVTPTEAGLLYYNGVKQMLALHAAVLAQCKACLPSGDRLRICNLPLTTSGPEIAKMFKKHMPTVELEYVQRPVDGDTILAEVAAHSIDVAEWFEEQSIRARGLTYKKVSSVAYCCVMLNTHPLAAKKMITL